MVKKVTFLPLSQDLPVPPCKCSKSTFFDFFLQCFVGPKKMFQKPLIRAIFIPPPKWPLFYVYFLLQIILIYHVKWAKKIIFKIIYYIKKIIYHYFYQTTIIFIKLSYFFINFHRFLSFFITFYRIILVFLSIFVVLC